MGSLSPLAIRSQPARAPLLRGARPGRSGCGVGLRSWVARHQLHHRRFSCGMAFPLEEKRRTGPWREKRGARPCHARPSAPAGRPAGRVAGNKLGKDSNRARNKRPQGQCLSNARAPSAKLGPSVGQLWANVGQTQATIDQHWARRGLTFSPALVKRWPTGPILPPALVNCPQRAFASFPQHFSSIMPCAVPPGPKAFGHKLDVSPQVGNRGVSDRQTTA